MEYKIYKFRVYDKDNNFIIKCRKTHKPLD